MTKWKEKILGEVVSISKGKLTKQSESPAIEFLPLINTDAVNGRTKIYSDSIGAILCEDTDILMLWDGERSGLVTIGHTGVVGSTFAKLKSFEFIHSKYLYYFLDNKFSWIQNQRTGTGVPHVPKNLDKILWIKYPEEKAEQRQIAEIIFTCDAVIKKTQAAIEKYRAIKQGLLYDMFTRGIDKNTGQLRPKYKDAPELYKESKLGMVPKMWEVERMESLTEKIGSGVTPTGGSEIYKSSGVLFLRSQNVLIGSLSIGDAAFITNEIDERMGSSRVKPFDVLLNITGASIGRCAYFPIELKSANVNQHVCIIRFKSISKSIAIFASEFMNSVFGQSQINRSNAGGNRDGLNFQQIKSFHFPVLEGTELEKISEIIETQNQKLFTEQAYLQKLQQIKAGLMDDLLSGKKAVIIKEEVLNG